jgi:hypothetical protein
MFTSQTWDCSPWRQPTERANPDEETTNWRAVCGRTARTVRREGRTGVLLYPYHALCTNGGISDVSTHFDSRWLPPADNTAFFVFHKESRVTPI